MRTAAASQSSEGGGPLEEAAVERGLETEQGIHLETQRLIVAAGSVQEGVALQIRQIQRRVDQLGDAAPVELRSRPPGRARVASW